MGYLPRGGFALRWAGKGDTMSSPIPGVHGGRLAVKLPGSKTEAWEYTIETPQGGKISGAGLVSLAETQTALYNRVPDLLKGQPAVTVTLSVDESGLLWTATLRSAAKEKGLSGTAGDRDGALLEALRAALQALKRPSKLRIVEPSGRLYDLVLASCLPVAREVEASEPTALESEIRQLAVPHFVEFARESNPQKRPLFPAQATAP